MANYLAIANANIEAGKPVTTGLLNCYRDNPIALYENTVSAAMLGADVDVPGNSDTDITAFNISAPADTVWRVRYTMLAQLFDPGPGWDQMYYKVYAASLAATPGYVLWRWRYQDVADAYHYYQTSAAVGGYGIAMGWSGGAGTGIYSIFGEAIVYVGATSTTIKLAAKTNNVAFTNQIKQYSMMMAQQISGTT